MMTSSPTQTSGGKPFCMEPQNSSACGAGFFLNKHSMKFEPCPDGKFVVPWWHFINLPSRKWEVATTFGCLLWWNGFFRGLWVRSLYHQYPKCTHGMFGTVGRGGITSHSFSSMKSKRRCHNLQSNPIGIYQRITPLQTRTTCYQGKTWRLTKTIILPGWIFFQGSEDAFRFVTNFRPRSKLVYFIRCRLCWFLQTGLGKPLHCDTRRTKLVNKGFTRIYVCVVTYYFID